jgi:transposase-like protein
MEPAAKHVRPRSDSTGWTGFDDKILSLYTRGMTVREIQAHLQEM